MTVCIFRSARSKINDASTQVTPLNVFSVCCGCSRRRYHLVCGSRSFPSSVPALSVTLARQETCWSLSAPATLICSPFHELEGLPTLPSGATPFPAWWGRLLENWSLDVYLPTIQSPYGIPGNRYSDTSGIRWILINNGLRIFRLHNAVITATKNFGEASNILCVHLDIVQFHVGVVRQSTLSS